jgi:hypothetical protein
MLRMAELLGNGMKWRLHYYIEEFVNFFHKFFKKNKEWARSCIEWSICNQQVLAR